ncbi:aldo/keto reductase [Gonapodya prolifera JEL478]|uniref:Aldo/keto reductase n=1 Tax=Gonapodya prolifera (strain JEL478) TaxID=1344416 RepID=A0A139A2Q8_GONPJ|nr:aldo/keto reductase [Gonapodya prolifera JEL478]|eukprot:KXS11070.1 aldo/keto reductase [Gonapodya prolifera JEL478]
MTVTSIPLRPFGKTGWQVSEIGFGAWQLAGPGGSWQNSTESESIEAAKAYLDAGGNLFDTANVYGDGTSERIIGKVLAERPPDAPKIYVLTKAGRCHGDVESPISSQPHGPQNYTYEALKASAQGSCRRLGVTTLDLLQLHCPPFSVLQDGSVFDALRKLRDENRLLQYFGVSVETCEEAVWCLENVPDLASIQIIFNAFRLKVAAQVLPLAQSKSVAIIPRVPLASGLLTGKITPSYISSLADSDHRTFNKTGQVFDAGETWSGLGHVLEDTALPAVGKLEQIAGGVPLSAFALRWILMFQGVSVVIPGCRTKGQVLDNVSAAQLSPLTDKQMQDVQEVYDSYIRKHVHGRW